MVQGSLVRARPALVVVLLSGLLGSGVLSGTPEPAAAQIPSLDAYRLRVPVAVLAAAADPDSELDETEQTALLSNTANGLVTFAPPIGTPTPVVAPAGSPLAGGAGSVLLPLISAVLGFRLGGLAVEAFGIDLDDRLCPGSTSGNLADDFIAGATGTNCTQWSLAEQVQNSLNLDAVSADPSLIGTVRCDPDGRCAEIYAVSQPGAEMGYCLRHVSGPPFRTSSTTGVPLVGFTPQYGPGWYGGSQYTTAPSTQSRWCPPLPNVQVAHLTIWPSWSSTPALYWAVDRRATYAPSTITAIPTPLRDDLERTIRCVVHLSDGSTLESATASFTLGGGRLPKPVCPSLPFGSFLVSVELWLDSSGLAPLKIGDSDASNAFQDWAQNFPQCTDGGCTLDLRKFGGSCFEGADCSGWIDDPNRDSTYECIYAGAVVPLSDCFIYGPMFESSGPAYGDYENGGDLPIETTLSEEDRLAIALLERDWLTHGPTNEGFVYGDAAENPDPSRAARAVAVTCVALGVQDECDDMPIFAPGDNVKEAAQHDLDAIRANPPWAELNYANPSPVSSGWYSTTPPCVAGTYDTNVSECDEYPFRSTAQAGPGASLRVIDRDDNRNEGNYLGIFYTACEIGVGDPYLVMPIPTEGTERITPTAAWCVPG